MAKRGRVFRMFETRALFENLETGNCLLIVQTKEGSGRELQVFERPQLPDLGIPCQVFHIEAIFGIYDLLSGSYAAVVVESESYVSVSNVEMRKAKKIIVIPLFKNGRILSETKQRDEEHYLQLLQMGFSDHSFFFSNTSDITLTQQRLSQLPAKSLSDPLWTRADHRFFWNREVVIDLISCEADQWIVPFMSAYVEVRPECVIDDDKFTLLFISRRSRYNQGCRFTKRGLNESGHAANFVETEQILLFPNGKVTSFVQIRGSIPLKWSSPVLMKYDPKVYIDPDRTRSVEWAEKHVTDVLSKYVDEDGRSGIVFINLVDNKKDQGRLGTAFAEVIECLAGRFKHPLSYIWFDFHHECKQKGKWKNLSKLIAKVDEQFKSQRFFCKMPNGMVTSYQTGVFRTNCMDNLDRTNVVQSLLARRSLVTQLGKLHILDLPDQVLETHYTAFEKIYKTVWANNADAISRAYAGTGALKVDFTKTGKRTFKGMINDGINSCIRYYINNFTDGIKQDSIDILLGFYKPDLNGQSPFVKRPLQETLSENVTKLFLVWLVIFATLMTITPQSFKPQSFGSSITFNFVLATLIAQILSVLILYQVVIKGSSIGERIVVHPSLIPISTN